MKNVSTVIFALLFLIAIGCKKDTIIETIDSNCEKESIDLEIDANSLLPDCLKNGAEICKFNGEVKTIRRQKIGNEYHYWINTDIRQYDGSENILNDRCETVSRYCGGCLSASISDYQDDEWEIIWEQ